MYVLMLYVDSHTISRAVACVYIIYNDNYTLLPTGSYETEQAVNLGSIPSMPTIL